MVLISFLKQTLRYFLLPHDKPSPLIAVIALVLTLAAMASSIGILGQHASDVDECSDGPKIWLAIGIVTDAAYFFAVAVMYWMLRGRAKSWDDADVPITRVVLSHWSVALWFVASLWTIIWIIIAFSRYPGSKCDGEKCCIMANAVSSINVFLIATSLGALLLTILTEFGAVPRWWRSVLSRDMRRREILAQYQEGTARAPSNADTDRAMAQSQRSNGGLPLDRSRGLSPPPPRPGTAPVGVPTPAPPMTTSRERNQPRPTDTTSPPSADSHFHNRDPPPTDEDRQFFSVIMGAQEANRIVGGSSDTRLPRHRNVDPGFGFGEASLAGRAAAYRKRAADRQKEMRQGGYEERQKKVTFQLSFSSDDERHSD